MSWTIHVDNMVKKATRRLYFLKQLKRSGLTSKQPVLEYCAPVWHYALTKSQTQQLEAIQKRAIQIVLNFSRGMPYTSMLFAADLNSLASRREDISRKFFQDITKPILLVSTISYQTQSYHPIILDSDLMKNVKGLILALNNIVHLCSMHWATSRTGYTMIRYIK